MNEINLNNNNNREFDIISKESIKLIAEQNGLENVTDEAILLLASDVSFRLREIIHNSVQFSRHSKRRRLTCNDPNKALEWSHSELLFGFESNDQPFRDVFAKDSKVYVTDDPNVDLIEESNKILNQDICQTKVFEDCGVSKIEWHSIESKKDSVDSSVTNANQCPQELIDYYQCIVKAILANDSQLLYFALKDLSSNPRISPILPYFINFISNGVKKLSHDISQLKRILNTIESLFMNPSLFVSSHPYLKRLVQSVVYCIVEPLNPITDHWSLRDSASHLLSNIFLLWSTPFGSNNLINKTITSLSDVLLDFSKPFGSHYGVIKAFLSFGFDIIIKYLYPNINRYLSYLLSTINQNNIDSQTRCDALKVLGELISIAQLILLKLRSLTFSNTDTENFNSIYYRFSDIFGDALYARLPADFDKIRIEFHKEKAKNMTKNNITLFTSRETLQSGEDLLDAFYQTQTDDINSNCHNLDDEMSCEDNSVVSDNEKEMVSNHVGLQIKSTIDDRTRGIKLTIKKLKKSQIHNDIYSKETKIDQRFNCEPVFERVPRSQRIIRFKVSGVSNESLFPKDRHEIDLRPSKWFEINKNNIIQKLNYSSTKKSNLNIYSCDLFYVL